MASPSSASSQALYSESGSKPLKSQSNGFRSLIDNHNPKIFTGVTADFVNVTLPSALPSQPDFVVYEHGDTKDEDEDGHDLDDILPSDSASQVHTTDMATLIGPPFKEYPSGCKFGEHFSEHSSCRDGPAVNPFTATRESELNEVDLGGGPGRDLEAQNTIVVRTVKQYDFHLGFAALVAVQIATLLVIFWGATGTWNQIIASTLRRPPSS